MDRTRIRFRDRDEAGRRLADLLGHLSADVISGEVVVLALPRGGVPVALPVAEVLRAPLDVLLVRKLGVPHHPELAMGAIGEGGTIVRNDAVVRRARVSDTSWRRVVRKETAEVARQRSLFRAERPAVDLNGVTSVIVDDGIATGSTVEAACQIAIHGGATRVVVAAPVAPLETVEHLRGIADEVVTVATPDLFLAIGRFYDDFHQVSDEEVKEILMGQRG